MESIISDQAALVSLNGRGYVGSIARALVKRNCRNTITIILKDSEANLNIIPLAKNGKIE